MVNEVVKFQNYGQLQKMAIKNTENFYPLKITKLTSANSIELIYNCECFAKTSLMIIIITFIPFSTFAS